MEGDGLALSPQQRRHMEILEAIAREMHDTPLVLKGGSAIVLGYRQARFTEDLDFDSPRKLNLENRIAAALQKARARLLPADAPQILKPKDTNTVQRYKLEYETEEGWRGRLKIETSFREIPAPQSVAMVDGIRMYGLETLIEHKLNCLDGRVRARDLVDVGFLAKNYPDHFDAMQSARLREFVKDPKGLEQRYTEAFKLDDIPVGDVDTAVLRVMEGVDAVQRIHSPG